MEVQKLPIDFKTNKIRHKIYKIRPSMVLKFRGCIKNKNEDLGNKKKIITNIENIENSKNIKNINKIPKIKPKYRFLKRLSRISFIFLIILQFLSPTFIDSLLVYAQTDSCQNGHSQSLSSASFASEKSLNSPSPCSNDHFETPLNEHVDIHSISIENNNNNSNNNDNNNDNSNESINDNNTEYLNSNSNSTAIATANAFSDINHTNSSLNSSLNSENKIINTENLNTNTNTNISQDSNSQTLFNTHSQTETTISNLNTSTNITSNQTSNTLSNQNSDQSCIQTSSVATTSKNECIQNEEKSDSPQKALHDENEILFDDTYLSFEKWKAKNLEKNDQVADVIKNEKKSKIDVDKITDEPADDKMMNFNFKLFDSEHVSNTNSNSNANSNDNSNPDFDNSSSLSTHDTLDNSSNTASSDENLSDLRKPLKKVSLKERINYAASGCNAKVLKTNDKASGASAILSENKDTYMINECSVKEKFVIVELCDDILIDTIVIGNFEYFSSMFNLFKVSVSDRYPVKTSGWKSIGEFNAQNVRIPQTFEITSPLIWARYVKVDFITQWGREFYCPVSLLQVYGTTMLEQYRNHDLSASDLYDDDLNETAAVVSDEKESIKDQASSSNEIPSTPISLKDNQDEEHRNGDKDNTSASINSNTKNNNNTKIGNEPNKQTFSNDNQNSTESTTIVCDSPATTDDSVSDLLRGECKSKKEEQDDYVYEDNNIPKTPSAKDKSVELLKKISKNAQLTCKKADTSLAFLFMRNWSCPSSAYCKVARTTNNNNNNKNSNSSDNENSPVSASKPSNSPSSSSTTFATPVTSPERKAQDSIYMNMIKRLAVLEANTTLSMKYLEEQGRILMDAFSRIEKRQSNKVEVFLQGLNETVAKQLTTYRHEYNAMWQMTIAEMYTYQKHSSNDIHTLTRELMVQKRVIILQSVFLLLILTLVLVTRGASVALKPSSISQKRKAFNSLSNIARVPSNLFRSRQHSWSVKSKNRDSLDNSEGNNSVPIIEDSEKIDCKGMSKNMEIKSDKVVNFKEEEPSQDELIKTGNENDNDKLKDVDSDGGIQKVNSNDKVSKGLHVRGYSDGKLHFSGASNNNVINNGSRTSSRSIQVDELNRLSESEYSDISIDFALSSYSTPSPIFASSESLSKRQKAKMIERLIDKKSDKDKNGGISLGSSSSVPNMFYSYSKLKQQQLGEHKYYKDESSLTSQSSLNDVKNVDSSGMENSREFTDTNDSLALSPPMSFSSVFTRSPSPTGFDDSRLFSNSNGFSAKTSPESSQDEFEERNEGGVIQGKFISPLGFLHE